jgi:lipid-binding SYLF domain-containing protein
MISPLRSFRSGFGLLAAAVLLSSVSLRAAEGDKYLARIETCEAILREFQADPQLAIPGQVLRQAQAVVIVNQVKGGLVLGLQYGHGVVLVRRPDGTWSIPVLVKAGEASLGLQLGGQRVETIYVLMDTKTPRLLFANRFNIGADASAVAGPRTYEAEKLSRDILSTPVLVYGRNNGYYAGATIKTGWIDRHDSANTSYYNTEYTMPELLYGNTVTPPAGVRPLMNFVTEISR